MTDSPEIDWRGPGGRPRLALVTGGSRGIGLATGEALMAHGCDVVLTGRDQVTLARAKEQLPSKGGTAHVRTVDLRSADEIERLVTSVTHQFGGIDILVHAAVTSHVKPFLELSDEDWRDHVDSKLMAAVRLTRLLLPSMLAQNWGRIVYVGGLSARVTATGRASNGVVNSALSNLTKHVAFEFAGTGVLVNTVHPGLTATPRLDMLFEAHAQRLGISLLEAENRLRQSQPGASFIEAKEVARAILFMCSSTNSAITGQSLAVDRGGCLAVSY